MRIFFFFSSRRRHTRCSRDWSSDVCSSDLNPKRQQVIIFKPPFAPDTPDYVKRVIGLPGDAIDIHDGSVWVSGQRLVEKYTTGPTEPYELKVPYRVPADCYLDRKSVV